MAYADTQKVPFVAIAGTEEMEAGTITLKNMIDGTQQNLSIAELINTLAIS